MAIKGLKRAGWAAFVLFIAGCASPIEPESVREPVVSEVADQPTETSVTPAVTAVVGSTVIAEKPKVLPGTLVPRYGDEIVAAGEYFRTGTPVVLWTDAAGYDGYRVERRFAPLAESGWNASVTAVPALSSPNRYSMRSAGLPQNVQEERRGGSWTLSQLQEVVDQLVLHYDVSGTSRACFEGLHDHRGLSIHFMIDVDGTIYQTLDLKEKAWHATVANSRSIGVEIAQIGAYPSADSSALKEWYDVDADGHTVLAIPPRAHPDSIRRPEFSSRPIRSEVVQGEINGTPLWQYDFTAEQYTALAHLSATLSVVFPQLKLAVPRNTEGEVATSKLSEAELKQFGGLLGHYHIQTNKVDPGPAFQWDRVLESARELLEP